MRVRFMSSICILRLTCLLSPADETGSVQYNYQVWKQQRNELIVTETQSQSSLAGMVFSSPHLLP